jgi:isopentenyl phosphate kinase
MLTLLKLGGSVITDKRGEEAADLALIRRLALEIRAALDAEPGLRLVIGHGSGSFGHLYARRYGVHLGLADAADWMGFARTSAAALRLNRVVVDELLAAGVPALALQPLPAISSRGGRLDSFRAEALYVALARRLTPVVHGDVAFDGEQGSAIISTEQLLSHLARHSWHSERETARLVLVGIDAVYTADPHTHPDARPIPLINQHNIAQVLAGAGGSHGVDVTGGMRDKVAELWALASELPGLEAQLVGPAEGLLRRALLGHAEGEGTILRP